MATSPLLQKLFQEQLEIDPYVGREYLADSVGDPPSPFSAGEARAYWNHLEIYGRNLWKYSRMALNYWTPERVEQEAYRRAGDSPSVSKIAQEVARFNVVYGTWVELAQGLLNAVATLLPRSGIDLQLSFMRESVAETLLALERRAQAAEQRASDLRVRYEFEKLRAVVSGRAMASEIAALIQAAVRDVGNEQAVYERFAPALRRLEADIREVRLEVQFVADLAGDEFVARQLPAATLAPTLAKLATLVPGYAGKVLSALCGIAPRR
jgi:hypothetical protein